LAAGSGDQQARRLVDRAGGDGSQRT
jgi:hypothetical protein